MNLFHREACQLKRLLLKANPGLRAWHPMLGIQGVFVCRNVGHALKIIGGDFEPSTDVLRGRYSLSCNVRDLKTFVETQCCDWGAHKTKGFIERPNHWRWILTGEPFQTTCCTMNSQVQRTCGMSCWRQRLQKVTSIGLMCGMDLSRPPFVLENMQAGLCFGSLELEEAEDV